jgi:hypothetical protein
MVGEKRSTASSHKSLEEAMLRAFEQAPAPPGEDRIVSAELSSAWLTRGGLAGTPVEYHVELRVTDQ